MRPSALAPVAIFAYRRTDHLTQTLDALERCPEFAQSAVFVYSDGAKNEACQADVTAVRSLLRARAKPNMTIIEATENRGLAASIIAGATELCDRFGRAIVVEDDLVVAPCTLAWFNRALDAYAKSEQVLHINGYQHYVPEFRDRQQGVIGRFVGSWGWATWNRAWRTFDQTAAGWEDLYRNEHLRSAFNQNDSFPLSNMLLEQMTGKSDSWAVRWFWTVFRSGGLTLSPPRSLIRNIGFDDTATHNTMGWFKKFLKPRQSLPWTAITPPSVPNVIAIDPADERAHQQALLRTGAMRNAKIKRILRSAISPPWHKPLAVRLDGQ
jgi:hypothetical protein